MKQLLTFVGIALGGLLAAGVPAQEATIQVNASQVLHGVSPYLTGACLEDVNHEVYGGIYSQMIFGESFQEPAPAPPVAGFAAYGGSWQVAGGALVSASGSGPKLLYTNITESSGDVRVQVQFSSNEGGDAGIIFQVTQPGVGADVFTGYEISLSPNGSLVLGRHVQDWEPINQVSCAVPLNQWINLEVQYTNAAMTVLVNGSSLIQYTDTHSPLTSGQIALRNYQQDTQFRNFSINGSAISFAYVASNWPGPLSGMWSAVQTGSATGQFSVDTTNPFVGAQSQRITCTGGFGDFGLANQGLKQWGMDFVAGKEYDGQLDARADAAVTLTVALESADGSKIYAVQNISVISNNWEQLGFALTPSVSDTNGRLAITLKQPGSVELGYVFLQPGAWGQFERLPVRNDVAAGLTNQGITVLRYGGSMVNAAGYRWKKMVGPRDRRPPYTGTWYPYSTDGWGIPDFLNFCEAAGFLGVPDFNINESAQDMADFIDYANGSTNTVWGAQRLADGHPQPYGLKYLELGNEERVDDTYFQKFQALAKAIWAKDANIILVVGDFSYSQVITNASSFGGAASGITSLAGQQEILQLAQQFNREVWFDLHVWTDGPAPDSTLAGMFSFDSALAQIASGARYRVVVFELNANNHSQRRALANALAINEIERDGRLPITTSANCLQPDGENDNGWDQGLLFLNPWEVWLQPPGYVTQMKSRNYLPQEIQCTALSDGNVLDASAKASADGHTLNLQVVNLSSSSTTAAIRFDGFVPTNPVATTLQLSASQDAVNPATDPLELTPVQSQWAHNYRNGAADFNFAPNSFTVLSFQGAPQTSPPAILTHRWSFNEPAGATNFVDSVLGVTNGFLHGAAGLDGQGNLVLPGLGQNGNYAELPPNLIESNLYTAVTFEFWVAFGSNPAWGRLLDFGDTNPDTGNGRYCLDFTPHSGYATNGVNFEISGADPGFSAVENVAVPPILDGQGKLLLTLVWDSVAGYAAVYTNGILMGMNNGVTLPLSAIVNAHSYLGKSSYAGDNCGVATVDEFRMYNGAMGAAQMAADLAAGPNALPVPNVAIISAGASTTFSWPGYTPGYTLQTSPVLGAGASWVPVSGTPQPVLTNGVYSVTLTLGNRAAFYRLVKSSQ